MRVLWAYGRETCSDAGFLATHTITSFRSISTTTIVPAESTTTRSCRRVRSWLTVDNRMVGKRWAAGGLSGDGTHLVRRPTANERVPAGHVPRQGSLDVAVVLVHPSPSQRR